MLNETFKNKIPKQDQSRKKTPDLELKDTVELLKQDIKLVTRCLEVLKDVYVDRS